MYTINKKEELCVNDKIEQKKGIFIFVEQYICCHSNNDYVFFKTWISSNMYCIRFCMIRIWAKLFCELDNENKSQLIQYNINIILSIGLIKFDQHIKILESMLDIYHSNILLVFLGIVLLLSFISCSCCFVFDGIEENAETSD